MSVEISGATVLEIQGGTLVVSTIDLGTLLVPQDAVDDESEIWRIGDVGTLVVESWWAKRRGIRGRRRSKKKDDCPRAPIELLPKAPIPHPQPGDEIGNRKPVKEKKIPRAVRKKSPRTVRKKKTKRTNPTMEVRSNNGSMRSVNEVAENQKRDVELYRLAHGSTITSRFRVDGEIPPLLTGHKR